MNPLSYPSSRMGQLQAGMLPGEATIMARYMGRIATWSTAVPRPVQLSSEHYSQLPRSNFIDDHVQRKLADLNILPSEACDETQYLRRLYLDVIGRLPMQTKYPHTLQIQNWTNVRVGSRAY